MSLRSIYTQVILDHYKRPRNKGTINNATHASICDNPLCGDKISLSLKVENDTIVDAKFEGNGCAISQASASMMTQAIKGKTVLEVRHLKDSFRSMLLEKECMPDAKELGDLISLEGVKKLHARIKCAVCAWHALEACLQGRESVSTEEREGGEAPSEKPPIIEPEEWEKEL